VLDDLDEHLFMSFDLKQVVDGGRSARHEREADIDHAAAHRYNSTALIVACHVTLHLLYKSRKAEAGTRLEEKHEQEVQEYATYLPPVRIEKDIEGFMRYILMEEMGLKSS
jgi:hypothetical protein